MKNDFIITIPSYKRAQILLNKPNTLDYLDDELLQKTKIVIRKNENKAYGKVFQKYINLSAQYIKDDIGGIVETRDIILSTSIILAYKKLIMIDDDIRFAYRPEMNGHYVMQSKQMFHQMIDNMLESCTEEYPIVGITARQFSNKKIEQYSINERIIQVYCFHLPTIKETNIHFADTGIPFMTDYYFIIKMLTLGYKNLVLNRYTRDDNMQMPGGCAETRTVDLCNESALGLYKLFPTIVKPYAKSNGTWGDRRINVRVSWKKAFNEKLYNERSKK